MSTNKLRLCLKIVHRPDFSISDFFIFSNLMNAVRSIIAGTPEQEDKNCY